MALRRLMKLWASMRPSALCSEPMRGGAPGLEPDICIGCFFVAIVELQVSCSWIRNEKTDMSKVHKVGCKLRANDCEGLMFDTRMRSVLQFLALLWFMAWLLHAWRVPYGIGSRAALLILTSCSPLLHQDQQRYNLDDAEFREERKYGLIWPCRLGIQYSQPFVCGDLWHAELEGVTLWTAHLMKTWDVQLEWEWHWLHFQERRWMERQNQRVRKKCPHKSLNNSWTMMMSLSFVLQLFGCFQHVSPPSIQVRWSRNDGE